MAHNSLSGELKPELRVHAEGHVSCLLVFGICCCTAGAGASWTGHFVAFGVSCEICE